MNATIASTKHVYHGSPEAPCTCVPRDGQDCLSTVVETCVACYETGILTTECPGRPDPAERGTVRRARRELVALGFLDYRDGHWLTTEAADRFTKDVSVINLITAEEAWDAARSAYDSLPLVNLYAIGYHHAVLRQEYFTLRYRHASVQVHNNILNAARRLGIKNVIMPDMTAWPVCAASYINTSIANREAAGVGPNTRVPAPAWPL